MIAPHAHYGSSRLGAGNNDISDAKLREGYHIVTPDEAIALFNKINEEAPDFLFEFAPILPGMDVDLAQGLLELFANKVKTESEMSGVHDGGAAAMARHHLVHRFACQRRWSAMKLEMK